MTAPILSRDGLEPGIPMQSAIAETSLHSIAISLKRIADALTPRDGAATCELVQQVSEMLGDRFPAAQPGEGIKDFDAGIRRFGNRP